MTWTRLHGTTVGRTLDVGLRAEVADPLWMVGRQWQLGELGGSDGGSPLLVDTQVSWHLLTRLGTGNEHLDLGTTPWEPLVEREPQLRPWDPDHDPDPGDWAARARAGRALVRALREAGCSAAADRAETVAPFTPTLEPGGVGGERDARYAALLAGRGCDAARVLALAPGDIAADDAAAAAVVATWRTETERAWGIATGAGDPAGWVPERLEHVVTASAVTPPDPSETDPFAVHLPETRTVRAPEYDGSGLDWHSFDWADPSPFHVAHPFAASDGGVTARTVLATRLTYPGQPDDRFFAFEDAAVRVGAPDAGPTDLVKLVVTTFTTVAGPDWLLVPVEVPVGSLASVARVTVRDTFGVATEVGRAAGAGRQFEPAGGGLEPGVLVVLPPAVAMLQSTPREEVVLQRDEGANLVWAIEHVVRGRAGGPVDRRGSSADFVPPPTGLDPSTYDLVWRVQTPVPPSWLPLVVQDGTEGTRRRLVPARLLDTPTGALPAPTGRVMTSVRFLHDEEVPRTGIRVTVHDRLARGADGSTHVWRARQKRAGRGESASGLHFDDASPT